MSAAATKSGTMMVKKRIEATQVDSPVVRDDREEVSVWLLRFEISLLIPPPVKN